MVNETLGHITLSLMEDPGKNIDSETFNLIVEGEIQDQLQFCLWGNIGKNPRYIVNKHTLQCTTCNIFKIDRLKEFSFKTRDFTLDLPKPMLLADVAVRVLYLSYDLLSSLSKTYHCPTNPSIVVESTENLIVKEEELGETMNGETSDDKSIRTTGTPKEPLSRVIIGKV